MRVLARSLLIGHRRLDPHRLRGTRVLAAGPPAKVTVTTPQYPHAEFGAQIVPCGVDIRLEALVVDADDAPVEGIEMAWTWEEDVDLPPPNPAIGSTMPTSVTDANGIAVSSVHLACVVGLRGVSAGTQGALEQRRHERHVGAGPVPAPNTSTAAGSGSTVPEPIAILVALTAVLGASASFRRTERREG